MKDLSSSIWKAWCNSVHSNYAEIVQTYGPIGTNPKSQLRGIPSADVSPSFRVWIHQIRLQADLAVGMSRQLHGLAMHSERPGHRMYEQYHQLGKVGIITAFNSPVAVWSWNALVAAVCGDISIWKPAKKTPLCAIATQHIVNKVLETHGVSGIMSLIVAPGQSIGEAMLAERRWPLISATVSCRIGRRIGQVVGKRLGRSILELGGNNAIIVSGG
jgi:aldehyde dehydrogenase (NAD+)